MSQHKIVHVLTIYAIRIRQKNYVYRSLEIYIYSWPSFMLLYVILSYHSERKNYFFLIFTPIKLQLECSLQIYVYIKKGKTIFSPNFYPTYFFQVKSPNNSYLLKNITCNMLRLNVSYNIHWKYKYNNDSACPSYLNTESYFGMPGAGMFSLLTSILFLFFCFHRVHPVCVYMRGLSTT